MHQFISVHYRRILTHFGFVAQITYTFSRACGGSINIFGNIEKNLKLLRPIGGYSVYADSVGHEILALNDGSYIMLENGKATLYGEAYMIKDRQQWKICNDGESISLST